MRIPIRARVAVLIGALVLALPGPTLRPTDAATTGLAPLTAGQVSHNLSADVFGYLPYWSIGTWTDAYLHYDLLTTIAFFGVGVNDNGTLNTTSAGYKAYMSDTATTIIQHAHAAGVRTVITFQSFGLDHNAAFFSNPTAQQTFVQQATALMSSRGADGANLDVELISGIYFPAYGALVKSLGDAARATNPIAQISVATNGNTSGSTMAATAVANGADRAFLMGYAYRSAGSNPTGSISPLVRTDGGLSLSASLDMYAAKGVPANRILLGLPYYGMTWPTVDSSLHAARQPASAGLGAGKAFFPSSLPGARPPGAVLDYDPVEQSARLTWFDATVNSWYQTYYDDGRSLAPKEHLVLDRGLGGMGIWALGYDRGQSGYWETIAAIFRPLTTETSYVPVAPARILDTREGNGLGGRFKANLPRTWQVTGRGGIPTTALAVTANVTVTDQTAAGFVTVTSVASVAPTTSTLNFPIGDNRANNLTVPLGPGGTLSAVYRARGSQTTHLILDVTGYFVDDPAAATYRAVSPARVLDTRSGNGLSAPFVSTTPRTWQVAGRGGIPAEAIAVSGNVAVTGQTSAGFVAVTPAATSSPPTSNLNFPAGDTRANGIVVPLGSGGTLSATFEGKVGAKAHLLFDVTGYFLPDQNGARFVALAPKRLLDTRTGAGLSGKFAANKARTLAVVPFNSIPGDAVAITGNLTVTNETAAGYVALTKVATNTPATSTLNFPRADIRANGVIAPLGPSGTVGLVYKASTGNTTDLILDVTGYFH
jgi:spore germination protein YaaH